MALTEDAVRAEADAVCAAVVAGNVERAIEAMSDELRRNVGEVVALLPLPASEAVIESAESSGGGSAWVLVVRIVGETDDVQLQTRWKDRNGQPKLVEVSHLSRTTREAAELAAALDGDGEAGAAGETERGGAGGLAGEASGKPAGGG